MSKTTAEIEEEIIDEFSLFDDYIDLYDYIIDIGKETPPIDEQYKTDDNLVKGCQSKVWLHAEYKNGKVMYYADSNTVITKGIVALLTRVLSEQKPDDILNCELGFLDEINLRSHLSSQRSNGLSAMIKQMKLYALGFKTKMQQA